MIAHHRGPIRAGLALLALLQAQLGFWAVFAPHSFYTTFPGGGHHLVIELGQPYAEHFIVDVGALSLALVAVLVYAAVTLDRRLVQVVLGAWLLWAVPHFIYHLGELAQYSGTDKAINIGGLAIEIIVPLAVLALTLKKGNTR